jgi:hypothetical protein
MKNYKIIISEKANELEREIISDYWKILSHQFVHRPKDWAIKYDLSVNELVGLIRRLSSCDVSYLCTT